MTQQFDIFDARVAKITGEKPRLKRGARYMLGQDGLILRQPEQARMQVPWKPLLGLFFFALLFKGMIYAELGHLAYAAELVSLADGSRIERVGAWIMQPEPVTEQIAAYWTRIR